MTSGIYTITNIFNNKVYVGYSKNLHKRKSEHLSALKNNRHDNSILQRVWNKYGENSLIFEILVECEERFLVSEEHYWATILNAHNREYGYNRLPTHPEKLSSGHSKETILKISLSKKGLPSKLKGTKRSQDIIDKLKETKKTINNGIKIKCLNDSNTFNSITEASKYYKLCVSTIINLLNNITKRNKKDLKFEYL